MNQKARWHLSRGLTCLRKDHHPDRQSAEAEAARLKLVWASRSVSVVRVEAYRCPACKLWLVGKRWASHSRKTA